MAKSKPIEFLAGEGALTPEVISRLKGKWVMTVDELYSRMAACYFSGKPEMKAAMAQELGIPQDRLDGFRDYIKPYVSQEVVDAQKPEEYPTGYRIK